ncbi:MAG: methionyl-tRNA formyltransferase [Anaerolineales bacterium]|nr:methionyl-tRNA formyltransferase [Anaerolineales bacterium]
MKPKIIFMGSPDFAVPTLKALAGHYPVAGVITQPDRASGRGRALTPPPVKLLALELGLPVIQPARLRQPEAMEQLRHWAPDLIVVAAFGQILRSEVLDLPQYGCINVHASLLPRWRGAAPIQAALLHGDAETGITIMCMDPGVDTGPTLSQRAEPILDADTASSLSERLAQLGAELLIETLPGYLNGDIRPMVQDDCFATYAPMLKKEHGELDFTRPSVELARQVRAFNPWPGAFTTWQGQTLKIHRAHAVQLESAPPPGVHVIFKGLPAIAASDGLLVLDELQLPGKKALTGKIFLQGARNWV